MPGPAIETQQLVREFKKGPRAVDGIDLRVEPGRDLRVPRAERRRQVDDRPHADDAAAADRRARRAWRATTSSQEGPKVRARDRRRAPGGGARPAADRAATTCGCRRRSRACRARSAGRARDELLERVGLTRGGRPQGRRLLGRDEAPARPRARARPPAADPLPRRADDRASTRRAAPRSGTRSRASPREDGVTVFLTTQYLEEADVLADRVGIIDHGRIVAEGTPAGAQGRDRAPERRGDPGGRGRARRGSRACSPGSASRPGAARRRRRAARRRG